MASPTYLPSILETVKYLMIDDDQRLLFQDTYYWQCAGVCKMRSLQDAAIYRARRV